MKRLLVIVVIVTSFLNTKANDTLFFKEKTWTGINLEKYKNESYFLL